MLIFRQLFDPQSSTYTYLIADSLSRKAVLIDTVFEQGYRDIALVNELNLELIWTLETHVHADHVTGAWLLKKQLGSQIALAKEGGAKNADRYLTHGDNIDIGSRKLTVRATPGHTSGCLTYVLDDASLALTGDCLLIRGCGRTDFQQGDPRALFKSVHDQIFTLPETCLLYPGHDYKGLTVTSVAEEKRYNPRLGDAITQEDFIANMNCLGLPHPKQIKIAVPANLKCGQPEADVSGFSAHSWLPLTFTFAGFWEIQPQALEEVMTKLQLIDVREPDEFDGPLGHLPGAKLIPLSELTSRLAELNHEQPIVTVCRSGARSAQAALKLQQAGFTQVSNLAGGLQRWRAEGLAVESGAD